jgi:hypothetical protein
MAGYFLYQDLFEPVMTPAAAETVTLDKWTPCLPEPTRPPKQLAGRSAASFSPEWGVITGDIVMTAWMPHYAGGGISDSHFLYQAKAEPVTVPAPETVTLDKWFRPAEQPYPYRRKPAPEGWYSAPDWSEISVTVTVDQWFQPTAQPYPYRKLPVREGWNAAPDWSLYSFTAPVDLDKWQNYLPGPIYKKRLTEGASSLIIEPTFFTTPDFDSWYHVQSTPVLRVPQARLGYFAMPEQDAPTPEEVLLDKWFQPLQTPTPPLAPLVATGIFVSHIEPIDAIIAPEMDSWWQPASEPRRYPPPPAAEGWIIEPVAPVSPDPTNPEGADYIALHHYEVHNRQFLMVQDENGALIAKGFAFAGDEINEYTSTQVVAVYSLPDFLGTVLVIELGDGSIVVKTV